MTVSILLRTQNAEKELGKFAERLPEGFELVMVDHASFDRTSQMARELGATVVAYPDRDYSYGTALNSGVSACTGDWVVVASSHLEPLVEHFWERMVQDLEGLPDDVLACQGTGFMTAHAMSPSGMTFFDQSDLGSVPWRIHGNSCCAYRRTALQRFPFDESLPSAEDAEWCLRVIREGFRIVVDNRLPYLYRNRAPLSRYWKRGRIDFPAMETIFGISFIPSWRQQGVNMVKDFGLFVFGRIPWWLWIRLVVRRFGEISLHFR